MLTRREDAMDQVLVVFLLLHQRPLLDARQLLDYLLVHKAGAGADVHDQGNKDGADNQDAEDH